MSYDADHALALREAQAVGYKVPDQRARASRAARRKARDPRALWSFYTPSDAERQQVEAIEAALQSQTRKGK